jgi:hypothetical protein
MKRARTTDPAAEEIYRVDTIPPPDGANDFDTKVGDLSLVIAEARRAAESARATTKMDSFDLAQVLQKQHAEGEPWNLTSGTRLKIPTSSFAHAQADAHAPAHAPAPAPAPAHAPAPAPALSPASRVAVLLANIVLLATSIACALAFTH